MVERAPDDHGRLSFEGLFTACSNSATVAGGAPPPHTSSITVGGATQATNHRVAVANVSDAPATTLIAAITRISAHHAEINRRREKLLNM
jgi:hypothetical protein